MKKSKNSYRVLIGKTTLGPFNLSTVGRLQLDNNAPNRTRQIKEIFNSIGKRLTLLENDGTVVIPQALIHRAAAASPDKEVYLDFSVDSWTVHESVR